MSKIKKVYKYATGQEIPEGAVYLSTQVETESEQIERDSLPKTFTRNVLVWHYFLVEVEKE